MVLFFRLTRRNKRLKKRCSLRFCRRHSYSSWFSLYEKQSAERVGVVLVACVSKCVRVREKKKNFFFCVFFFLFVFFFLVCVLFLFVVVDFFFSVFAMMKKN